MAELDQDQIRALKGRGFLRNRGTDLFSGRVVSPGGVYTPEQLACIGACAQRFGNGTVAITSRQSAEVVGIPYENIDAACSFIADCGLVIGGTGPKIRPVTACKGTTCVFGSFDTQALAKRLHHAFYLGWSGVKLPHKFKIAVGGCPNSCVKPSLNDFGVEGRRTRDGVRFAVYVGGTWGRKNRQEGRELSRLIEENELFPTLEGVLHWYQSNAGEKERLFAAIDRLGMDSLEGVLNL